MILRPRGYRSNHRSSRRTFRRLHRYAGLTAALLVLLLATTGLLLNHSASLRLGSRHIGFAPLLAWYNLDETPEINSFRWGTSWVSCVGEAIFIDRQPLPAVAGCPVGVVKAAEMWVIATPQELVLLTAEGELIERLGSAAGVPQGISSLGTRPGGTLALATTLGWQGAGPDLLQWQHLDSDADVAWSRPGIPPKELRDELLKTYRGHGLTVERFVQDLHSGRLFGRWGPLVMDAAAVLCLVLVVSGWVLWRQGGWGRRPPPSL